MNEMIYVVNTASKRSSAAGIWIDLEDGMDAVGIEEAAKAALRCRKIGYAAVRGIPECLIDGGSLSGLIWDYLSLDEDKKSLAMRLEQAWEASISNLGKIIDDEYSEYDGWGEVIEEWFHQKGLPEGLWFSYDVNILKRGLEAAGDYVELGLETYDDGYIKDVIIGFHH